MPLRSPRSLAILVCLALGACGQGPPDSGADVGTEGAGVGAPPGAGAAVDSVTVWIEDIRAGIAPLPAQVASDPEGARQRAVELYVTRQERIEQAVGPGTGSDAALAESVHDAEARFHELMQILGTTPPPDSASVGGTVSALDSELARVLGLARATASAEGTP